MRILQINKFFFLKGGAERYFFDLAELLSLKGHQVLVWSTRHPNNFDLPGQENFAQLSDFSKREGWRQDFRKLRRIFWNREAKDKLERIITKAQPDIAHLHNFFSHLSPSIVFALKKHNIPIVMTLHDYKLFCPNYQLFSQGKICLDCLKRQKYRSCLRKKCLKNSFSQSLIGYLENRWQRNVLKLTDKIDVFLAPSQYIRARAIEAGLLPKKVVHLPNFINQEAQSKRTEYSLVSDNLQNHYFLYFGRLSQEKGLSFLIESFLAISERLPGWRLKIVGDGPIREKLESLAQGHQQIEFLGRQKGHHLQEVIGRAYLVIVPSLWPENFPYGILESFILKKAVLASAVGGIPELVREQETGFLFQTGNKKQFIEKIFWAAANPEIVEAVGQRAQEEVQKYNSESHYQQLIKIYERVQNH